MLNGGPMSQPVIQSASLDDAETLVAFIRPVMGPDRAERSRRFDSVQARVSHDLTRELTAQYAGVFTEQTISTYVRSAVDDLRGSANAEALPELASRLAHHRLTAVRQSLPGNDVT